MQRTFLTTVVYFSIKMSITIVRIFFSFWMSLMLKKSHGRKKEEILTNLMPNLIQKYRGGPKAPFWGLSRRRKSFGLRPKAKAEAEGSKLHIFANSIIM